jgi:hypothetical protein
MKEETLQELITLVSTVLMAVFAFLSLFSLIAACSYWWCWFLVILFAALTLLFAGLSSDDPTIEGRLPWPPLN